MTSSVLRLAQNDVALEIPPNRGWHLTAAARQGPLQISSHSHCLHMQFGPQHEAASNGFFDEFALFRIHRLSGAYAGHCSTQLGVLVSRVEEFLKRAINVHGFEVMSDPIAQSIERLDGEPEGRRDPASHDGTGELLQDGECKSPTTTAISQCSRHRNAVGHHVPEKFFNEQMPAQYHSDGILRSTDLATKALDLLEGKATFHIFGCRAAWLCGHVGVPDVVGSETRVRVGL